MSVIATLVKKDIANFVRNRSALVLTFVVPIALIYVFGWVFGLNSKSAGPRGIGLAVVNECDAPAARKLVAALQDEKAFQIITQFKGRDRAERPLTEADLRPLLRDNAFRFAVVIPPDAVSGFGLRLKMLSNPLNEIETQTVNGLLQKTIFTTLPEILGRSMQSSSRQVLGDDGLDRFDGALGDVIARSFGGDPAKLKQRIASGSHFSGVDSSRSASPSGASVDPLSQIVRIEAEQVVGRDVKSPQATRVVGGWAMMFLLFALSNGAAAFFDEKNSGIFQRLLAAPVSRGQLLWSRFAFGVLLGLVQLTALFGAGQLLYGIDVLGHLGLLLLVCAAAAAACTAFGMAIAAFTPNAQAAGGLATLLVLTMSATGGAWFPISLMPPVMQSIGKLTLVFWAMDGFAKVLWTGDSLVRILPTLGVLLAMAAAVMAASVWRLNRRRLFE